MPKYDERASLARHLNLIELNGGEKSSKTVDDQWSTLPYTSEFTFKELTFDMIGTFNEPFVVQKKKVLSSQSDKYYASQG